MTGGIVTVTSLGSYRNERRYPFCPGCGHGTILDALGEALVRLGRDASQVVVVSDIGCSGLSDQYFSTSAFHGLHGRSITYATGIKLARPDLAVIVVLGDGGTGIGGAHLLAAARRNVGITVLVLNNMNFGMTGGQHSTTTPDGAITTTTPAGNLERPLDVCATVAVNGAAYAWRGTSFDGELSERMLEALRTDGFALLDVWELCTAHYARRNGVSRKALEEDMADLGMAQGVQRGRGRPEFAAAHRAAGAAERGVPLTVPRALDARFGSMLDRRLTIVMAGSAGGRVRSAARLAGRAAILSGLWAAQRDDYPITVQSGHSVSTLVLAPEAIQFTGATRADVLLVLTRDGLEKARPYLAATTENDLVFAAPGLPGFETRAPVHVLGDQPLPQSRLALTLLPAVLLRLGILTQPALQAAAALEAERYVQPNVAAVDAGALLAAG